MSINIQLDGKLQKISGQTMTKEKIIEKLGYTPANETTLDANITELNSNLDILESALEEHKNSMSDIDAANADDKFVIADPSGNIIAKIDDEGVHTTGVEAESFTSNDKELAVYDEDGNAAFKVDENGITHAAKLKLNSGDVDDQLSALSDSITDHASKTVEHVNSTDRDRWDNKSDFSGNYSDLVGAPNIVEDESGEAVYADEVGNIIFKIDADGAHTTKLELTSGDVDTQLGGLDAKILEHAAKTDMHVTAEKKAEWDAKSNFSGEFKDLVNSPITEDESGELVYTDEAGNIIFKVDQDGAHTTELTLAGGKVDERLGKLAAGLTDHKTDVNNSDLVDAIHLQPGERATWNNKSDIKSYNDLPDAPNITPEDNEDNLVITDNTGNIVLKAGQLDEDTTGLETTTVKAKVAIISNIYTKPEVDAQNEEHATATQNAINNLKTELSESMVSESDSLTIVDEAGNIGFMVESDSEGRSITYVDKLKAESIVKHGVEVVTEQDLTHEIETLEQMLIEIQPGHVLVVARATADANGNIITGTYATKAELSEQNESIVSEADTLIVADDTGNKAFEVDATGTTSVAKLNTGELQCNAMVWPIKANKYSLGNANHPWSAIFAQTPTIQTSDRNKKNNIQSLTNAHEQIFDALEPVSYKFNENESGRTHTGFIAQDVKKAILEAGLTTKDFAAYCEWEEEDGGIGCGLRYEELLALCVKEIQKLKKKIAELEEKIV